MPAENRWMVKGDNPLSAGVTGESPIYGASPHSQNLPGGSFSSDDPDEMLTVQEAAKVLKVSYSHMLRLVRGEVPGLPPVPHVRAGRTVRIRRGALTDWIRHVETLV